MTEKDISTWNIFQRMHAVTAELGVVQKNLDIATKTDKNGRPLKSYKAVNERDVLDAVKPLEEKYRIMSYPESREIVESDFLVKETNYGEQKSMFMRMKVFYKFVNIDNPQDFVISEAYGDGIDTGDKAPGKAMTYSDKYALMKAYKISTGDDPDAERSEEYDKKSSAKETKLNPTELKKKRARLKELGVNTVENQEFIKWFYSEANVTTQNEQELVMDPDAYNRAMAAYNHAIQIYEQRARNGQAQAHQ